MAGDTFVNWAGYPAVETLRSRTWSTTAFPSTMKGDMQATFTSILACPAADLCFAAGSGGPGNNQSGEYAQPYLLLKDAGPWQFTSPLDGFLLDLSCPNTRFCVGVGYGLTCSGPAAGMSCTNEELIETYEQGAWRSQLAPLASGQSRYTDANLSKVSCPRAGQCVAIGGCAWDQCVSGDRSSAVIVALSNGRWRATRAPLVHGATDELLNDIACPRPGDCQIVGSYQTGKGANARAHALFASQQGTKWKMSTIADGPYEASVPDLIRCPSTKLCFAAGRASVSGLTRLAGFQWSDGRWSSHVLPYGPAKLGSWSHSLGLASMACSSTQSCMAVGAANWSASPSPAASAWSLSYMTGRWRVERIPDPPGLVQSFPPSIRDVAVNGRQYISVGDFHGPNNGNRFPDGKAMVAFFR